jgi:ribosome biogenesis GTPase A
MPVNFQFPKFKSWLLKQIPFEDRLQDVFFVSGKTGKGIESISEFIHNYAVKGENSYLVGCTNAGKSTILNSLKVLQHFIRSLLKTDTQPLLQHLELLLA